MQTNKTYIFSISVLFFVTFIPFVSSESMSLSDVSYDKGSLSYKSIKIRPYETKSLALAVNKYDWFLDLNSKAFYPILKDKKDLSEFHFNVTNFISGCVPYSSFFYGTSFRCDTVSFDKFISKNRIDSSEFLYYDDGSVLVSFYGLITDLDPEFVYTYTTNANGFFNNTVASISGITLSGLNTSGYYSNYVFFNQTEQYWNTLFSVNSSNDNSTENPFVNDSSLVSYYKFSGNINDIKNINNGTCSVSSCPQNTTGVKNGAMLFDGTNDYINLSNPNSLNSSEYTFSAWFKTNAVSADDNLGQRLITITRADISSRITMMLRNNKPQLLWVNSTLGINDLSTGVQANDGYWHHFVSTYNDTYSSVYLDGVLKNSSSVYRGSLSPYYGAVIGYYPSFGYFNGSIDEVMIFNRSLSSSEISNLSEWGKNNFLNYSYRTANSYNTSDPTLIAGWGFNNDSSGMNGINNVSCTFCPSIIQNGIVGESYNFTNNWVNSSIIQDLYNYTNTISLWYRPSSMTQTKDILSISTALGVPNPIIIIGQSNSNIRVYTKTGSIGYDYFVGNLITNTWKHIVVTYNGSSVLYYLDGVLDSSEVGLYAYSNANPIVWIGSGYNGNISGSIDEVRIYNRSLSADEVLNLYQLGSYHLNWSDTWKDGLNVSVDSVNPKYSLDKGKFYQFRLGFNSVYKSPYLMNHSVRPYNDLVNPYFYSVNKSSYCLSNISEIINISDDLGIRSVSVNDSRFVINNSGYMVNVQSILCGNYSFYVTVLDNVNKSNSSSFIYDCYCHYPNVEWYFPYEDNNYRNQINNSFSLKGVFFDSDLKNANFTISLGSNVYYNSSYVFTNPLTYSFEYPIIPNQTGVYNFSMNICDNVSCIPKSFLYTIFQSNDTSSYVATGLSVAINQEDVSDTRFKVGNKQFFYYLALFLACAILLDVILMIGSRKR